MSPAPRTALIAGATGAIGSALLQQALASPHYTTVKALTRRPLGISHPRLIELRFDGSLAALGEQLQADDVFCCLGTTLRQAGSKAAFERVDYHLVVELARAAHAAGAQQFLVISAAGTSAKSLSFYSRVKARMEQTVSEVGYRSLHILRPSLLLAERSDQRPAEDLAQKLAPLVAPLMVGKLARYRPIAVADVAAAMLTIAQREQPGQHIHHLPLD